VRETGYTLRKLIPIKKWQNFHIKRKRGECGLIWSQQSAPLKASFISYIRSDSIAASLKGLSMLRHTVVCACLLLWFRASLYAEDPQSPLPTHWSPNRKDLVADALQVWRRGANYFNKPPVQPSPGQHVEELVKLPEDPVANFDSSHKKLEVFLGFTADTEAFLNAPHLAPGVQFSCAVGIRPVEPALIKAMKESPDPEIQVQALVLLLRVQSPSTVESQWATLQKLKALDRGSRWKELLSEMERVFDPNVLQARLADWSPPKLVKEMDRYGDLPAATVWAMRAAGLMQCKELLPKLKEWSINNHLDTSLEAERSLENFTPGPDADKALAYCVKGWQYNAAEKAAHTLLMRNPKLITETLLSMKPPGQSLYAYGLLLGQCGDPSAVPILCKTVKDISIVDGSMFHFIEKLAQPEHLDLIKALPNLVRPNQKPTADRVLKNVLNRLK